MMELDPRLDAYVLAHTSEEPPLLQALARETGQKVLYKNMLSGHLQGRMLSMISRMMRPSRVLEIGSFTGYSALCLAEGLSAQGSLVTVDVNDELEWLRQKYYSQSPYARQIEQIVGNGMDVIQSRNEAWDLVFVDADKSNYPAYYEALMERLQSGAWLVFDNVLWYGKVTDTQTHKDKETLALDALNKRIQADDRVEQVVLPIRDGLTVVQVK